MFTGARILLLPTTLVLLSGLLLYSGISMAAGFRSISHLYDITVSKHGTLVLPTDVANYKDQTYIVDSGNNRIVVAGPDGQQLFTIGRKGTEDGEFHDPVGIGVGQDGIIYIADTGNNRIQYFSDKGIFVGKFTVTSGKSVIRPIDVASDPVTGNLYVTGNNNHKLMVFSNTGQFIREWGGNGAGNGEFRYPATVAVTKDARVAVVDVLNTRAQLFRKNGEFMMQVGGWGVLPGQLFRPKGIAVNSLGQIYISDSYMNVVQVYNEDGKFMHVLKVSEKQHNLLTPSGIAVDTNDRLYIAEMLKHRVSVYQIER